jgi:hypothetical protein
MKIPGNFKRIICSNEDELIVCIMSRVIKFLSTARNKKLTLSEFSWVRAKQ